MDPAQIRQFLLSAEADTEPVIFTDLISDWPASQWTPETLSQSLTDQKLRFRIGLKRADGVLWETRCQYEEATISDFLEWLSGSCSSQNPLHGYSSDTYWCYADYKYMAQMFSDRPDMLQAVQWRSFGFDGRAGQDSTWWLGSAGAYTVCHYDTYGCNLVAQLYGRKRWLLFPPEGSSCLYPTRLPYEESSVFSRVNIRQPDLTAHPAFRDAVCYEAVLEPGQVLFVPRQWWHLVESLDTSISVNTWIEMSLDREARLQEAVTRLLACSLMSGSKVTTWLNPTEEFTSHELNLAYVKQTLRLVDDRQVKQTLRLVDNRQETDSAGSDSSRDICSGTSGVSGRQNEAEVGVSCRREGDIALHRQTEADSDTYQDGGTVHRQTAAESVKEPHENHTCPESNCELGTEHRNSSHDSARVQRSSCQPIMGVKSDTTGQCSDYDEPPAKVHRTSSPQPANTARTSQLNSGNAIFSGDFAARHIKRLAPMSVMEIVSADTQTDTSQTSPGEADIQDKDVICEVLQPDVIRLICEKLKAKCQIK